eukprot:GSMAST32.ASY1.ANO1.2046.1 assembled CDS
MGNNSGILSGQRWSFLPAPHQDKHLIQVELENIFSSDFLTKYFRGKLEPLSTHKRLSQSNIPLLLKENNTDSSIAYLNNIDPELIMKHQQIELVRRIRLLCETDDIFTASLCQRVSLLQWVHQAHRRDSANVLHFSLNDQSINDRQYKKNEKRDKIKNFHEHYTTDTFSNEVNIEHGQHNEPSDISMCLRLLALMISCITEPDFALNEKKYFLLDLSEVILNLAPASIVPSIANRLLNSNRKLLSKDDSPKVNNSSNTDFNVKDDKNDSLQQNSDKNIIKQLRLGSYQILDAIRDFLYCSTLYNSMSTIEKLQNKEERELDENKELDNRCLSIKYSTCGVTSLLGLALARGSLHDLLLVVATLLDIPETKYLPKTQDKVQHKKRVDAKLPSTCALSVSGIGSSEDNTGLISASFMGIKLEFDDNSKQNMCQNNPSNSNSNSNSKSNDISDNKTSKGRFLELNVLPYICQIAATQPTIEQSHVDNSFDKAEVWTCGQNSYGELAHDDDKARTVLTKVNSLDDKNVVQVAAGNEHTIILTRGGVAYTAGYNDNGQCGLGNTSRVSSLSKIDSFSDQDQCISHIHAYNGCEHSLVVTTDGKLWSFGYNYRGQLGQGNTISQTTPKLVNSLSRHKVALVSCSYYHSFISCDSGDSFSFGRNDFGQLGLGDKIDKSQPQRVDTLLGIHLRGVACGQYHSMVATDAGKVLACGKNDYGQLGIEGDECHTRPTAVLNLTTLDGLISFGRNDYGQLGLGHTTQRVHEPTSITELEGAGICKIAAGCYHTVAVAKSGLLYVFGRNNHGQLGTGDTNERHKPVMLQLFLGKHITSIATGFYHTIVLTGRNVSPQVDPSTQEECTKELTPKETLDEQANKNESNNEDPLLNNSTTSLTVENESLVQNSYSTLVTRVATQLKLNSKLLLEPISPYKTAVLLLAHIERLATAHSFMKTAGFQSLISSEAAHDEAGLSGKWKQWCNRNNDAPTNRFEPPILPKFKTYHNGIKNIDSIRPHLLHACLQILKLNIIAILKSGIGARCMLKQDYRSADAHDAAMRAILRRIHTCLVHIIETPLGFKSIAVLNHIQRESAYVLVTGLELFYPSREQKIRLLTAILDNSTNEMNKDCIGSISKKTKSCLLGPLLERMNDNTILSHDTTSEISRIVSMIKGKEYFEIRKSKESGESSTEIPSEFKPEDIKKAKQTASNNLQQSKANANSDVNIDTESSEEENWIPANPRLSSMIKLLLSQERLLFSWAGNDAVDTEVASSGATLSDEGKLIPIVTHATVSFPGTDEWGRRNISSRMSNRSTGTRTSQNSFTQSYGHQLSMPISIESDRELFVQQCVKLLKSSLVGSVLPSLVTGLLLFARHLHISAALLPTLSELLRGIDDFNKLVPAIISAESSYYLQSLPFEKSYIPWLLTLEKTLGVLAGRFAATLILGNTYSSDTDALNVLELKTFLTDLVSGKMAGGIFAMWMRLSSQRKHFGYRMALRQGSSGAGIEAKAMDKAERALFATLLCHTVQQHQALAWCRGIISGFDIEENQLYTLSEVELKNLVKELAKKRTPPRHLLQLWDSCVKLRMWLVGQRSALMAKAESHSNMNTPVVHERSKSRGKNVLSRNGRASSRRGPSDNCSFGENRESEIRRKSKWRIVRMAFHCTRQWKLSLSQSRHESLVAILSFVRRTRQAEPKASTLLALVLDNVRRAVVRQAGLNITRNLIDHVSFTSVKSDMLRGIPHALLIVTTSPSAVFAPKMVSEFTKDHNSMQKHQLKSSTFSINGATVAELKLVAIVLNAWALHFRVKHFKFLASVGIFDTLENFIAMLQICSHKEISKVMNSSASKEYAYMPGTTRVQVGSVGEIKRLQSAVWSIFRLLSVQIVTLPESFAIHISPVFDVFHRMALRALAQLRGSDNLLDGIININKTASSNMERSSSDPQSQLLIGQSKFFTFKFVEKTKPEAFADITPVNNDNEYTCISVSQNLLDYRESFHADPGNTIKSEAFGILGDVGSYSISLWIFPTKEFSKHHGFIFGRSCKENNNTPDISNTVYGPFICIQPTSGRVYVTKTRNVYLISKNVVPLFKWTHISLVLETKTGIGTLYVNGELNNRCKLRPAKGKTRVGTEPLAEKDNELEDNVRLPWNVSFVPLSGSIAQCRYYARALSFSEILKMKDNSPVGTGEQRDTYGYQICSLLSYLARSKVGKVVFIREQWLRLFVQLFVVGTTRLQHIILIALGHVLKNINNSEVNATKIVPLTMKTTIITCLLQMMGKAMWRKLPNSQFVPTCHTLSTSSRFSGFTIDTPKKNNNITLPPPSVLLASGLSNLLRDLAGSPLWEAIVKEELKSSICSLPENLKLVTRLTDANNKNAKMVGGKNSPRQLFLSSLALGQLLRGLASLCILGGNDSNEIHLDNISQSIGRKLTGNCDKKQKCLMNRSIFDPQEFIPVIFHFLSDSKKISSQQTEHYQNKQIIDDIPANIKGPEESATLRAQLLSRTMKVLKCLLQDVKWTYEIITSKDKLAVYLLDLASKRFPQTEFVNLDEMETKVLQQRQKLFDLQCERYQCMKASKNQARSIRQHTSEKGSIWMRSSTDTKSSLSLIFINTQFEVHNDNDDNGDSMIKGSENEPKTEFAPIELVHELMVMGFPKDWCNLALKESNNDIAGASTWIIDNLDLLSLRTHEIDDDDESQDSNIEDAYQDEVEDSEDDEEYLMKLKHTNEKGDYKTLNDSSNGLLSVSYDEFQNYRYPSVKPTNMPVGDKQNTMKNLRNINKINIEYSAILSTLLKSEEILATLYARASVFQLLRSWISLDNTANTPINTTIKECKGRDHSGTSPQSLNQDKFHEREKQDPKKLENALFQYAMSHFVEARYDRYKNVVWGAREFRPSDSTTGMPCVELSLWIFRLLIATKSPQIFRSLTYTENTDGKISDSIPTKREIPTLRERQLALEVLPLERLVTITQRRNEKEEGTKEIMRSGFPDSVNVAWHVVISGYSQKLAKNNYSEAQNKTSETKEDVGNTFRKSTETKTYKKEKEEKSENTHSNLRNLSDQVWFTLELSDGIHGFTKAYHGQEQHCTIPDLSARYSYTCRVRTEIGSKFSSWSPLCRVLAGDELPFRFDPSKSGPNIHLSPDGLTASFTSNEMWSTVLGTSGFAVGINRWAIHIEKSVTAYIFIGVATRDVSICNFLGGDAHGWGYIGDRALYHQRAKLKTYGERFSQGDTIGVVLDMDRGTLSFSHNGVSLGIGFEGLSGKLFPAVAFYNRGQRLSLVQDEFHCPGIGIYTKLSGIVECVRCMIRGQRLSKLFLHRCYEAYVLWISGDSKRSLTRGGNEIQFNLSEKACSSLGHGFLSGDRVQTPRGVAVVVGLLSRDEKKRGTASQSHLSFVQFCAAVEHVKWTSDADEIIIDAINNVCFTTTKNPWNLGTDFVKTLEPKLLANSRGALTKAVIEARLSLLKEFNDDVIKLIPFSLPAGIDAIGVDRESLGALISDARRWLFVHEKKKIIKRILAKSSTKAKKADDDYDYPDDLPQVVLNRPKASAARERMDPIARLSGSLFGQLFDELHFLDPAILRIAYSHPMDDGQQRAFKVKFEGEGVDDYGGPYRECFAQLCSELTALKPKAPNNQMREQLTATSVEREHTESNPAVCNEITPRTSLYLEMFNFMGQLLGISLRNRISLPLELASMIWKPIVGQTLTPDDIRRMDKTAWTSYKEARNIGKQPRFSKSKDSVSKLLREMNWTTITSDGTEVTLGNISNTKPLNIYNLDDFLHRTMYARMSESQSGTIAIREGLFSVVPKWGLAMLTWKEMRTMVCGQHEVNIDMLAENTEYDDDISIDDPHVQSFWRTLRNFTTEDKCAFMRFVWARSRLPATSEEMTQKFKIQAPAGSGPKTSPDIYLPKAHTCFFSLNLPKYSSDEIMRTKLLYAIHHCVEMDADFRLADNEMGGWDEVDIQADLKENESLMFG